MNVGSVSRSRAPESTQVPPPVAPEAAPIDTSRDIVETGLSSTMRGPDSAAAIATPPASRPFVDPQIRRAAEAFVRGGLGGIDSFLQANRADARWLLSIPRSELTAGLRNELATRPGYGHYLGAVEAYRDAAAIDQHLAEVAQPQIREAVRQTAVGRIDAMVHSLESMSIDRALEAFRQAPAGSPLAELRDAFGIDGSPRDGARLAELTRVSLHELRELRGTLMGQTWMPEEFPGSMAAVQRAMGLERVTPSSIGGQVLFRGSHDADARAHAVETALDTAHVVVEGSEVLLHASHVVVQGGFAALATDAALLASLGGTGFGIAGLVFGYALHRQIEHNRAERTETAAALGL
ncbi:MAG: hypothetical protein ACK6CU_18440 [Deltaproteobacteria bacterium]|jgi:hypothetical protein